MTCVSISHDIAELDLDEEIPFLKARKLGARIRAGRIRQLIVSAASGYTGLAYPRSSDTFGAVSSKRGSIIIVLPRRSATRGSATEVRGYTGRAYPRSADRHDTVPEHRGNK